MVGAPKQDWFKYDALTRNESAAWIRSLSPRDRFEIYQDLFNVIWNSRRDLGDWENLDLWNREQKLAIRLRMVEAYFKLDQVHRERAAANNSR
jgi:hypothetical protein